MGSFIDARDGRVYKTVVIAGKTWMAQNLNYSSAADTTWCYNDSVGNCATFGRLYEYTTALAACPTSWHLPDTTEWNAMTAIVGDTSIAGTKLKAKNALWNTNTGTDAIGFAALPGGFYNGTQFSAKNTLGEWWTSTSTKTFYAYRRVIAGYSSSLNYFDCFQSIALSVRCVKD